MNSLPLIVWLSLAVVELTAYVALVAHDRPWWGVPVLVIFAMTRRPKGTA